LSGNSRSGGMAILCKNTWNPPRSERWQLLMLQCSECYTAM
jgi:hypothetical protein